MPEMISANRLTDGVVVFYDAEGNWVEALAAGALFADAAATKAALAKAQLDEARNMVVDIYAFAVKSGASGVAPVTLRDAIRAGGPTIAYAQGFPPFAPKA